MLLLAASTDSVYGLSMTERMHPVRMEGRDGSMMYRMVRDFEHSTLCRAFSLDQARFYFDLPSSVRGVGSESTGNRRCLRIDGYVMLSGESTPYAKLTVASSDDRFRDYNPMDVNDIMRLGK